jgi:hypothetical protein
MRRNRRAHRIRFEGRDQPAVASSHSKNATVADERDLDRLRRASMRSPVGKRLQEPAIVQDGERGRNVPAGS